MDLRGSGESTDKSHLKSLLGAARQFIGSSSYISVTSFYRNKPEEYFERVLRNNVLPKILKDKSGDQLSPINGRLSGVFLGVSLFNGRLPTASPFGDTRVQIPIEAVFDDMTNLYFTDFYCISPSFHYVTLVLTKHRSREDIFCKQHLIKLDKYNNPFLRMRDDFQGTAGYSTIQKYGLMVEVFYTEPIDLGRIQRDYGRVRFSKTGVIGKGTSTWGGLRKNTHCGVCNPLLVQPDCNYVATSSRRSRFESSDSGMSEQLNPNRPEQGSRALAYVCVFILIAVVVWDWVAKGRFRSW